MLGVGFIGCFVVLWCVSVASMYILFAYYMNLDIYLWCSNDALVII